MRKQNYYLPHCNVYCRIAPSKIHGVGVFAIRPISLGQYPFSKWKGGWTSVPKRIVDKLPKSLRKMYHDFFILRKGVYEGCRDMNQMNISFYLNSSKNPNMACDENNEFYALRDIQRGRELTVDYDTYSEQGL